MSHDDDKFIMILDKISEISERTARMEVEQNHIKEDLEEVKRQDIEQNKLLAEHIQGVKLAQARIDNEIEIRRALEAKQAAVESRVEKLEESPKFKAMLKKYILGLGAIAGVIVAILKILKLLNM